MRYSPGPTTSRSQRATATAESKELDSATTVDADQLAALRRFESSLDQLEALILRCAGAREITERDERRHHNLVAEAQILYGYLSDLIGPVILEAADQRWDAFQFVLSNPRISSALQPYPTTSYWYKSLAAAQFRVRQTIGRLQKKIPESEHVLSPEIVARWQPVIMTLEKIRRKVNAGMRWARSRPSFQEETPDDLEERPQFRLPPITPFGIIASAILLLGGGIIALLVLL